MLMIVECNWTRNLGEGYKPKDGIVEYNIHANTNNEAFDTAVEELSPFTRYDCKSYTISPGGRSEKSDLVSAETLEDGETIVVDIEKYIIIYPNIIVASPLWTVAFKHTPNYWKRVTSGLQNLSFRPEVTYL